MIFRIFFITLLILSTFIFVYSFFNCDSPAMVGVLFVSLFAGMPVAMIGIALSFDPDINS
jgi:hypothetical protein